MSGSIFLQIWMMNGFWWKPDLVCVRTWSYGLAPASFLQLLHSPSAVSGFHVPFSVRDPRNSRDFPLQHTEGSGVCSEELEFRDLNTTHWSRNPRNVMEFWRIIRTLRLRVPVGVWDVQERLRLLQCGAFLSAAAAAAWRSCSLNVGITDQRRTYPEGRQQ